MFTGIVRSIITITDITHVDNLVVVAYSGMKDWNLAPGDSVLIDGICSTISQISDETWIVEYMPQTIRITLLATWQVGQRCNAEPSLTLQTPLSGWLVTGHVDTVGTINASEIIDSDVKLTIGFSKEYDNLVMSQGSITLDGVNLTISDVRPGSCSVQCIPFTIQHTTIQDWRVGDTLNIEFDYFAKVLIQHRQPEVGVGVE